VSDSAASLAIDGREGCLVSVRISTDPRHLEALLEALALASFPVNPQLYHRPAHVTVEFPAWTQQIDEVRRLLAVHDLDPAEVRVRGPLEPVGAE
jgi:hypothetical protein